MSTASRVCLPARDHRLRAVAQGSSGHLAALKTGDGQPLPLRLKAELLREIELIELLIRQIAEVEVERDTVELDAEGNQSPVALLARLKRSARRLPRCFILKVSTGALPTDVRWPLMRAGADPMAQRDD